MSPYGKLYCRYFISQIVTWSKENIYHLKLDNIKKWNQTLLIYLAKANGKIEEDEKAMFSDQVEHLDNFTNTEKQKPLDFLSASSLPELTKKLGLV